MTISKAAIYQRWYRAEYPDRNHAHTAVQIAKRSKRLIVRPCERCGSEHRVHGHHTDYNEPLSVWWLCGSCHIPLHRGSRAALPDRILQDPRLFHVAPVSDTEPPPDHKIARLELRQAVWSAIDQLPPKRREALVLRRIHGMTLQQVGHSMRLTRERVRQLVESADDSLRRFLSKFADEYRPDAPFIAGTIAAATAAESEAA